jgi:UDP-GlcNAc:undecaprenyl-phosphate GlcNAc-1-phosphate transferase
MMDWWQIYLVVVMAAAGFSLALTPLFQKVAERTGFVDTPKAEAHKLHREPIPLLGGPAMFLAWAATIGLGCLTSEFAQLPRLDPSVKTIIPGIQAVSEKLVFICLGALLAVVLGLLDDKKALKAGTKLAGQIIIAAIAVTWGGVRIHAFFSNPCITWCLSVFWILLVINSINFFDNMDGLAAGTATIALSLFTVAAIAGKQYLVAALGAAGAGACLGFWFFNHSPASIFMGDSGSHFLGYLLAVVSAGVTYYNPEISTTRLTVLTPLFILAIPLFDTAAVVVIRTLNGKPIYVGDHNHISHRFVRMGMDRKRAVLLIHLMSLTIGLSVLTLLFGDERTSPVSIVQAFTLLLLTTLLQYSVPAKSEGHSESQARKD